MFGFLACTYVRFLKGKKTLVLDSSIFYCKKYFLLLSYSAYFCIRYNRNMIPEYIKEIALSICIFHLFTVFIVILQYRKNDNVPYLKKKCVTFKLNVCEYLFLIDLKMIKKSIRSKKTERIIESRRLWLKNWKNQSILLYWR